MFSGSHIERIKQILITIGLTRDVVIQISLKVFLWCSICLSLLESNMTCIPPYWYSNKFVISTVLGAFPYKKYQGDQNEHSSNMEYKFLRSD